MTDFYKQSEPVKIPVPGNKLIEEHFGKVATGDDQYSVAHMKAPAGWSEPAQTPEFDEITIMIRGKMKIIMNGEEEIVLKPGESFLSGKGMKVQYANPYKEENEYWSVCVPAFSVERAKRTD
jgi:mannose-6-phosphate isomerase-like protein (cupin superfamily)